MAVLWLWQVWGYSDWHCIGVLCLAFFGVLWLVLYLPLQWGSVRWTVWPPVAITVCTSYDWHCIGVLWLSLYRGPINGVLWLVLYFVQLQSMYWGPIAVTIKVLVIDIVMGELLYAKQLPLISQGTPYQPNH